MTEEKCVAKGLLGPTGEFPDGKLREDDEGELAFAVGVVRTGDVFMDFGKPIRWLAFPPEQAQDVAKMLKLNAEKALKVQELMQAQAQAKGNGGELLKP
jgi:hypothetical protein